MAPSDLAHSLEIPRLREHHPEVHHRRLHDQAGRCAALLLEADETALERVCVVERNRDGQVRHLLRDATAVRERRDVVGVEVAPVDADAHRHHHPVVMPVVGAEHLEDRVPPFQAAGDPNRVHRRLGARVREAPLGQAEAARQLFGHHDPVLGRGGEVRAQPRPLGDRLDDCGMGVTHDHRAEAVVEVPELPSVDVPDPRPFAALEIDRPRVARVVRGRHTERHNLVRALEHAPRLLRRLLEPLRLALGQLADPPRIDRRCLPNRRHATSLRMSHRVAPCRYCQSTFPSPITIATRKIALATTLICGGKARCDVAQTNIGNVSV